jgi:hypothetical protein
MEPEDDTQVKPDHKFKPGQSGNPAGKPKGIKNKLTRLKQAFPQAFEAVGGKERFTQWADENYTDFIKLFVSLLPKQRHVSIDTTLTIEQRAVRAADAFFEGIVVEQSTSGTGREPKALSN